MVQLITAAAFGDDDEHPAGTKQWANVDDYLARARRGEVVQGERGATVHVTQQREPRVSTRVYETREDKSRRDDSRNVVRGLRSLGIEETVVHGNVYVTARSIPEQTPESSPRPLPLSLACDDIDGVDLKPDPLTAVDEHDLWRLAIAFWHWAGEPSSREIAARSRGAFSHTTANKLLKGDRRVPFKLRYLQGIIRGCGGDAEDERRWTTGWRTMRGRVLVVDSTDEAVNPVDKAEQLATLRRALLQAGTANEQDEDERDEGDQDEQDEHDLGLSLAGNDLTDLV